jgi:outer membrane protein TolC
MKDAVPTRSLFSDFFASSFATSRLRGRFCLLLAIIAFTIAGCGGNSQDAGMILTEHDRLAALDDPSLVATAAGGQTGRDIDGGRWAGRVWAGPPASRPTTQPVLKLTIQQAVVMALDRNRELLVQRVSPEIARQAEQSLYGQFDPLLTGQISAGRTWPGPGMVQGESIAGQAAIQQFFPTGTTVNLGVTATDAGEFLYGDHRNDTTPLRLGLTITQALLQGASLRVNLATIRQARLNVLSSQYNLRGFTENLAGQTEQAYITYLLDLRTLQITESALKVAQAQLDEVDEMIHAGKSAPSDRAATLATLELRKEDRINARSQLEQARLTLLTFINGPTADLAGGWGAQFELTQPPIPVGDLDPVDAHVRVAMLYRSDLNQARLQAENGDLQVVLTRDGLLPKLDLFADLGRTWYFHTPVTLTGAAITNGNSTTTAGGTVLSAQGYANGGGYDATVGLNFSYPILNRAATAAYRSALATRDQADKSVANLAQQVDLSVRSAYQEAVRAKEQISAATATLDADQAALDVERERYRVGKSTPLLVSLAEQQVLNEQIAQATAVASYLNDLVALYVAEGSLLERRGLITVADPAGFKTTGR